MTKSPSDAPRGIPVQLARNYLASGLCVLPAVAADKRPALPGWRAYQERLPTEKEVEAWFANNHGALCLVAGAASGNLECIDFDAGGECFGPWKNLVPPDLFGRLVVERTPSGGFHAVYRAEEPVEGNLKLATGERNGKRTTLVETRGEGGLFLCAPSPGYHLVQGAFGSVPTISAEERRVLLEAARTLSEASGPVQPAHHPAPTSSSTFDERPGDAYNGDAAAFCGLLERHGWRYLGKKGENESWQRPGKSGNGLSATYNGVNFHVFSSNADPFPPGFNGSPFTVYALLEHGGDATAAAKDLLAQGYGKTADPCAGVDLSGILKQVKAPKSAAEPAEREPENPGQLPEKLLDVPGFVNDLKDYTLRTAKYPNRPLALAGALAMLSMLTGRKFRNASDNRTNLYLLALAPSSAGKDAPRRVNMSLAVQTGFGDHMGDAFASGEGLEDALTLTPCMLFQTDEIAFLFNSLKGTEARFNTMNAVLLKAFTTANGVYARRRKAIPSGRGAGEAPPAAIRNPHLVVYGTATPEKFYQSLNKDELVNGLVGRCLVFEGERRRMNERLVVGEAFPDSVLNTVSALREIGRENLLTGEPQVQTIPETPEARELAREFEAEANKHYDDAYDRRQDAEMAIWGRAFEKAEKLAMLYALSRSATSPQLTPEAYRWGWDVAEFTTRRLLYMADCYVYDSEFEKEAQKVVRILRDHDGRMTHSRLLRASRIDKDAFRRVIDTLVESERIEKSTEMTGQRPSVFYRLGRRK